MQHCHFCGDEWDPPKGTRGRPKIFCSEVCKRAARTDRNRSCVVCGTYYIKAPNDDLSSYCSPACQSAWFQPKTTCKASTCNEVLPNPTYQWCSWRCMLSYLQVQPDDITCAQCHKVFARKGPRKRRPRFCSQDCRTAWVTANAVGPSTPEIVRANRLRNSINTWTIRLNNGWVKPPPVLVNATKPCGPPAYQPTVIKRTLHVWNQVIATLPADLTPQQQGYLLFHANVRRLMLVHVQDPRYVFPLHAVWPLLGTTTHPAVEQFRSIHAAWHSDDPAPLLVAEDWHRDWCKVYRRLVGGKPLTGERLLSWCVKNLSVLENVSNYASVRKFVNTTAYNYDYICTLAHLPATPCPAIQAYETEVRINSLAFDPAAYGESIADFDAATKTFDADVDYISGVISRHLSTAATMRTSRAVTTG